MPFVSITPFYYGADLIRVFKLSCLVITSFLLLACGSDDESTNGAFVDSQAPVITLNGDSVIIVGQGRPYIELHATAVDDVDGEINVELSPQEVDTETLGDYTLVYTARDSAGNESSVIRTVSVVEPRPFITTWQIDAANEQIDISTRASTFTYNFIIDWGDGTIEEGLTGSVSHIYNEPGVYTISINGAFPNLSIQAPGEKINMLTLEQWGDIKWESMADIFYGAENITNNATDLPDLRLVEHFSYTFANAKLFNTDLSLWDTSKATTFYYMFEDATSFEFNISDWDVSNVENMRGMFNGVVLPTETYDQILNKWSQQPVQNSVIFDAGNSQYSIYAEAARDKLITEHSWTITDGGLAP
ncbi:BspA family leucine-rich repeat surface protein [Vibrio superstes]|uniref:PKD domain-containing protein n=1 Tax=Vibrio superstes NBRC 103154 TaxID=1219062 RepID=A0A511QUS8_9VIBR|nr:BspA family leucine-rich repeat surface protein [Vibrio superstes]GEM80787.1 hypothetical protein VSU01S_30320 [Vibrio superstes NBRC 103154]